MALRVSQAETIVSDRRGPSRGMPPRPAGFALKCSSAAPPSSDLLMRIERHDFPKVLQRFSVSARLGVSTRSRRQRHMQTAVLKRRTPTTARLHREQATVTDIGSSASIRVTNCVRLHAFVLLIRCRSLPHSLAACTRRWRVSDSGVISPTPGFDSASRSNDAFDLHCNLCRGTGSQPHPWPLRANRGDSRSGLRSRNDARGLLAAGCPREALSAKA